MVNEDTELGAADLIPSCVPDAVPWVSVAQMREVDRAAIAIGFSLPRMMENAGAALAATACAMLGGDMAGRRIAVLAGRGSNGGGGLVAARRLIGWGADVEVRTAGAPEELAPVTLEQLRILERMHASVAMGAGVLSSAELFIDAITGYSQQGNPHGIAADLIAAIVDARVPSLDVPSGLELEHATIGRLAVRAERTLTLALAKAALAARDRASAGRRALPRRHLDPSRRLRGAWSSLSVAVLARTDREAGPLPGPVGAWLMRAET
jgi:NAD(P)H-hydrate epimerase